MVHISLQTIEELCFNKPNIDISLLEPIHPHSLNASSAQMSQLITQLILPLQPAPSTSTLP